MIIFLYGQDTYRSRQKLNEIVEHYKKVHPSGLDLRYFDFKKDEFADFKDAIRTASMFGEKKLMVLKNTFSQPDFKEKFLEAGQDFVNSENIVLFHEEGEINAKDSFFVFLKESARCQEFELLDKKKLRNWIKKEFQRYGRGIGEGATNLLLEYVGNDLWQLSNEIQKLALYKKEKISAGDVKVLVRPKIETDIFKTIDAIAEKNKSQALSLIHKHLKLGDSPLYILSMINFQFRNLLLLKSKSDSSGDRRISTLARELKLHPFVVRKTMTQIKRFTLEELKKIYQKLFEIDLKIKTGQIEPKMGLDLLITEI